MKKNLLIIAITALFLSGCSLTVGSATVGTKTADSSLFLSTNSGESWRSVASIPSTNGRAQSIGEVNVNLMSFDPQDHLALYLATFDRGLFYTYNATKGWNHVAALPQATISDVKVDPRDKCVVYAALANRLYRSDDCTRTWKQVYFDNDGRVSVNTIAVDQQNSRNIYIGTSRGEIIKSIDGGEDWRTIQRLGKGIYRLIISPLDSRLIFVATTNNEIYSFTSNSQTNPSNSENIETNFNVDNWLDLDDVIGDMNIGSSFRDLIISPKDGTIFLASEKMILRSPDNGISWETLDLIPPENGATINAIAVNPSDSNDIYYVTDTTFYRSSDAGVSWKTNKLPTKRAGRELLIDPQTPNVMYLGTIKR
jgi:photosystem II stability/assembly factor-like uncharacterized protein